MESTEKVQQSIKGDPNFKNSSAFLHEHWDEMEGIDKTIDIDGDELNIKDIKFKDFIELAAKIAKESERGRFNFMLHKSFDEDLQCLVNAVDKVSYVPPHKHNNSEDRRETFTVVRGHFWILEFDNEGEITKKVKLDADNKESEKSYTIETGVIHTVVSDGPFVTLELKQHPDGGYDSKTDKVFMPWAPKENSDDAKPYNDYLLAEVLK